MSSNKIRLPLYPTLYKPLYAKILSNRNKLFSFSTDLATHFGDASWKNTIYTKLKQDDLAVDDFRIAKKKLGGELASILLNMSESGQKAISL